MRRAAHLAAIILSLMFITAGVWADRAESSAADYPYRVRAPMVARDAPGTIQAPSPAATPTTSPPATGIALLGKGLWYTDGYGSLNVVGIVQNNLDHAVEFVDLTANYYDESGRLLGTDSGFAAIRVIGPNGTSPFEIYGSDPGDVSRVELLITDHSDKPRGKVVTGLSVVVTNTRVDSIGWGHIAGTVTNNASTTWTNVDVALVLQQDNATYDVTRATVAPATLAPGQAGTFEALIAPHKGLNPVVFAEFNILAWSDAD